MGERLKVKEHQGLERDPHTGAIINTNTSEYQRFVQARQLAQKQESRISELEQKVEQLISLLDH